MEQSDLIPYIPKDALVPVEIGAGVLFRLQKLLMFLLDGRSKEELQELQDHVKERTVPEDSWMYHVHTVHLMISTIEQTAIDKKIVTYKKVTE